MVECHRLQLMPLKDQEYFEKCLKKFLKKEKGLMNFLLRLAGSTTESQANFIFTEPVNNEGKSGKAIAQSLFQHLEQNDIYVRYFPNHRLTQSKIRISIGTQEQMTTLFKILSNGR